MALPPGQHLADGFPRFGTHLHRPPPAIPADPEIRITGAVTEPIAMAVAELASLPRSERTADFHCVSGWSAVGLRWEGVSFASVYREWIAPVVAPGAPITHLVFGGLDRHRSVVLLEDVLAEDVLIADRLDGRPLDGDHGAPVRLVSPSQYGYVSTKHLCEIQLHTSEPSGVYGSLPMQFLRPTTRARVWEEERHRVLPGWSLRLPYRLLIAPIRTLSARGRRS